MAKKILSRNRFRKCRKVAVSVAKVAVIVARVAVIVATEVDGAIAVTAVTVPVDVVDSREVAAAEEDVGRKLGGLQREKLT